MGGSEVADDENESTVNDSIKDLFHRWYLYNEIVGMLAKQGVVMHIRTRKRKLKDLGLFRRGCVVDEETLRSAISEEIAAWFRTSCWISKCLVCIPIETPNPCAKK